MKIAVLTSRLPYPLERGDKLRIYHQIVELAKLHEVHLFALTAIPIEENQIKQLRQHCKAVHTYQISLFRQGVNLLKNLRSKLPFQTAMLMDDSIKARIEVKINDLKIDLIYCQLIRMAPYAIGSKLPKIIDFMDAFGIGMDRRAKLSRWPLNWFYTIESKRVLAYEEEIAHFFDERIIISDQDKEIINSKLPIHVVTNGIDTQFFKPIPTNAPFDVVFVGNMGYLPNVEAAEILVNQIAKIYKSNYLKDLRILIAGARPSSRVLALKNKNVAVNGWYDDIRDAYASGKIMVAPLFHGTGQQNKILEAMAMGLPCVTTNDVNQAINAENKIEIFTSDEIETMAEQIHNLLTDNILYKNTNKAGLDFAVNNYSWRETVNQLNAVFHQSIDKRIKH